MLKSLSLSILLAVLAIGAGCRTPAEQRAAADKDVYQIIGAKQQEALGDQTEFSIDTQWSGRDPAEVTPDEVIGTRQGEDTLKLNLTDALRTAVTHSPAYQTRKENLYISALSLSGERYKFDPHWSDNAKLSAAHTSPNSDKANLNNQLSVSRLLAAGGTVGATLTNDLLRYVTGPGDRTATTTLSVNLVQPLLRGFGPDIVQENLTQLERNVIYEVRSFTRYQRTFAVDIVSKYYRLVQQQDTVRNEYNNYRNLVTARQRAEALAADRLPEFQVDQTRQDELRARNRYILAVEQYQADLDSFKLQLGLPLATRLSLDADALAELTRQGLVPLPLGEHDAIERAITHRLDLLNDIDKFDDSKRKIVVAADKLGTDFEFYANAAVKSDPATHWQSLQLADYTGELGLRLKLPLDRLNERNSYRQTFIDFERRLRDLALAVDNTRNDIRTAIRTLERARKNYEIQTASVALASRRVESANLLLQAGRAETRDLLDAQSALVTARNALTQSIVDYHLARFNFLRDTGSLDFGPDGLASQLPDPPVPPAAAAPQPDDLPTPDELF